MKIVGVEPSVTRSARRQAAAARWAFECPFLADNAVMKLCLGRMERHTSADATKKRIAQSFDIVALEMLGLGQEVKVQIGRAPSTRSIIARSRLLIMPRLLE